MHLREFLKPTAFELLWLLQALGSVHGFADVHFWGLDVLPSGPLLPLRGVSPGALVDQVFESPEQN